MAKLRITEVKEHGPAAGKLLGCRLDKPGSGQASAIYGTEIAGWALGDASAVKSIEVKYEGRPVIEIASGEKRPDIAAAFPDAPGADACGFRAPLGALDLRAEFQLALIARLEDGSAAPVAQVSGRRERLPAGGENLIQPLVVNTIGRSGSTWFVWLLGCHPEAVAFRPYARDARVATYWMGVAQGLARPQSYLAQLVPGPLEEKLWWFDRDDLQAGVAGDPGLEEWLGTEAIESLATTCQSRIEAFYRQVAGPDSQPRFFVEKFLPFQVAPDLLAEVYPEAREVILVRDFRDQLCSVIAFNEKRGYQAFGRGAVASDAEYVETTLANSARRLLRRLRERGDGAYLVRYEDLIQEPEATLTNLCRFLGIDASETTVSATIERADAEAPKDDHHRTAGAPSASIGRWRRDLSPELARLCGEKLDPVLSELGYEPTLEPAAES